MTLLKIRGIETYYGLSQALFGVNLDIQQGSIVALMGRNGMGKTTTIASICRMTPQKSGTIQFAGIDMQHMRPHQAARLGIGLVPEGRRCFANLTVQENLVASARPGHWDLSRIHDLFPVLKARKDQYAGTLSGGEQQMLAISRALMTNPRLLILDEATEGLAPIIRQQIWTALRTLKEAGQTILIVDKTLVELLVVADHCVVMEKGRDVWRGAPRALNRDLQLRYLGV